MTVLEYAETNGITVQGVRQAMKRYSEELNGHVKSEGKKFILDDFAVGFLDEHIRKPSKVLNARLVKEAEDAKTEAENNALVAVTAATTALNTELTTTRQKMLEHIDKGFEELSKLQATPYDDSHLVSLIEDLKAQIGNLQKELDLKNQAIEEKDRQIKNLNDELKAMTDKYVDEASKSAWQKMFGKK